MDTVRFGIISTANIGTEQVVPALQQCEHCEVVAISSRSADKAQQAAEDLNISRAYGSYEELLADSEIDAVYNPLPNNLHVSWSLKALEAGKHVLCEKPIAMNSEEAETFAYKTRKYGGLKVMEAFMYRFHPQWQKAKKLVSSGEVGSLQTIHSIFSYHNTDPNNIRNKPETGGGGLMDIGCYNISSSRFLYGEEPEQVLGNIRIDPEFGVDWLASGILIFPSGQATFTCSTQMSPHQRVKIFGSDGDIEIMIPFNAPTDRATSIYLTKNGETEELTFDTCNQYTLQGDAFAKAILKDTPVPTPLTDALANMRVIDALKTSGEQNAWVELS